MSGGHFDYQDSKLVNIISRLEEDIEYNDIPYNMSLGCDQKYGQQFSEESIKYMQKMVSDLCVLQKLLHEYDYAVSGDTSEDEFLNEARKFYNKGEVV